MSCHHDHADFDAHDFQPPACFTTFHEHIEACPHCSDESHDELCKVAQMLWQEAIAIFSQGAIVVSLHVAAPPAGDASQQSFPA